MKLLRAITFGMAWTIAVVCLANNYYFQTIDVRDGLVDNYVRDVVRDHEGYVWISTINGLSRYDGLRFQNFMPMQYGARANDVSMVRCAADSTLWMQCVGELFTYDRSKGEWKKDGMEKLSKLGVKGSIKTFYVDDTHHLWIETEYGLYYYDYSQDRLLSIPTFNRSPIAHIVSRNGTTVIVTIDYKLYIVSLSERRLVPIGQAPVENYNRDSRVFLDSKKNLWLFNSHSMSESQWILSLSNNQWRQFPVLRQMENVIINAVSEDHDGNIWIGTENAGLRVFEYRGEELVPSDIGNMHPFVSHSSHISTLYLDKNNTMWVGSAKLGVAFTDLNNMGFNVISTGKYEDVSALVQDQGGNLWIGFDGSGVVKKSPAGEITYFTAQKNQLPSDIVTSLAVLGDGTVVVGTYGSGIAKYDGTKFIHLHPGYVPMNYVKAISPDAQGNMWVATVDRGVIRIDSNNKITNYTSENSLLLANGVLCLACDSLRNMMYIGTAVGVSSFNCTTGQFIEEVPLGQLKGSYISTMSICHSDALWVGSRNGLWIYQPRNGTVDHLTTEQGLSHNTVRALAISGRQMWASTDNGLTAITTERNKSGKYNYKCDMFLDRDGLQNVIFSNDAAVTTLDGTAFFGCYTGYVSIRPDNFIVHYPKLLVQFTDYRINGKTMGKGSLKELSIEYDERPTIFVSAMVPSLSRKIRFYYRFKGEEQWANIPNSVLYFANLNPGSHILQVKAILPSMAESDIIELPIHVAAPFWLSKPAFFCYFVLLVGLIFAVIRTIHLRQKRELAIRQMEMNLEKYEMEEAKIRFFTNISHDLKTPLTLVVAPLEKIRESNLPAAIRTEVDVAWRNARQLYDLVMELLDFRRLDVGKEKLNKKHGDIVSFVRQTVQGFAFYAIRKQIKMQLKLPTSAVEINFDENKLRRIITNLLSNAYKYNVDNGSVIVKLDIMQETTIDGSYTDARQLVLSVADTGIGVRNKRHIFDRFMQESHGQEQEGSGIGLHIVKQYVEMMGGAIEVTDNMPSGSIFTVTLPVDDYVDQAEELIHDDSEKPTILVVEDNMDARLFLQRSLADEYNVLLSANGSEALRVLSKNEGVSIVISDVMMPVMDGMELFRSMKENIRFSHIPVILLTAKSDEKNVLEGLQEGVADYITKPFSLAVLRLRISKILEWTRHVHDDVAKGIDIEPSKITVSSLDEELLRHVMDNIEVNIHNIDYSVAQLSSDVGMTRGHLYKKMMAITGKSPLEFIRLVKLKRGKSLLDQGRSNISEVADKVGLSPKQFAHYFKQMYGDTPTDYLKKHNNQPKNIISV